MKVLCHKLIDTSDRVETVGLLPVTMSLSRLLLKAAKQSGQQTQNGLFIDWKKSQQVIGNEIGVTRESVNKQLNQWKKQGILSLGGQSLSITIHDLDALQNIADG
ncbi:Crp/Fnr family transcriptional regulator [Methyloprofundus sp.]|uniref:Crp/Fnr family transcriptional regulator n=1 Tax=Methyloprofundus sp. TaxID=2020875 RepID=UPI003D0A9FED